MAVAEPGGMTLGARLRKLRRIQRWRLADMASAIGVSPEALSQYERDRAVPRWTVIARLIDVLGISLDVFTDETPDWREVEERMLERRLAQIRVNDLRPAAARLVAAGFA